MSERTMVFLTATVAFLCLLAMIWKNGHDIDRLTERMDGIELERVDD